MPEEQFDDRSVGRRDLTVWTSAPGRVLVATAQRAAGLIGPDLVLVAIVLLGGAVVVAMTGAAAELYESVVEADGVASFDRPALDVVKDVRTPALNQAVTAYTYLGGTGGLGTLATLTAVTMSARWRQRTPVVLMLVAAIGSVLMTVVGKAVVGRSRPPLLDAVPPYESSAAFPSGHALNSLVLAGVVAYLLIRRQRSVRARTATAVAAGTFAFLMGLSRIYLGHHWVTDVLVAWALALAWLTTLIVVHRLYLTVSRRRASP